jgi:UDP-N-acetylglucosamine--N-acetylmuramyl-(pentapeptide) pyrophosphoryl-undecaprenol N-acetylglucosamine transferase
MRALFAVTRTGGHVVPALGVAEALLDRVPLSRIRFVGTEQGVESRLVPLSGFELETIPVAGLSRRLNLNLLLFPLMVLRALQCATMILRRFKPSFVFCTGGYVSGPVGIAAWMLNIPLVLHEQNNFPGLSVRLLSRISRVVFLAFSDAVRRVGGQRKRVVGNPIRTGWKLQDGKDARRALNLDPGRKTLLVFGGSQGARGINRAVEEALPALLKQEVQILWQTGKSDYSMAKAAAEKFSGYVIVTDFIDDMAQAYSAADLAVTRAGAMTVTELTQMKMPAIMVPLPTSAENHQEYNAKAMVRSGAARMLREADLNGERLAKEIVELLSDTSRLAKMRASSASLAVTDSAERVVSEMIQAGVFSVRV